MYSNWVNILIYFPPLVRWQGYHNSAHEVYIQMSFLYVFLPFGNSTKLENKDFQSYDTSGSSDSTYNNKLRYMLLNKLDEIAIKLTFIFEK